MPMLHEMQDATGLRVSYKGVGTLWKGALKDGTGKTVWLCAHLHKNRDNGTHTFGQAARGCAWNELYRRFRCEAA